MPENTDQNNSEYTHFLGSVFLKLIIISRNTKAVSLDWSYYTASNGSINVIILITCILVLLMANQDITVIYSSKSSDIRQTSKPSLLLVQSQQWKRENNV